MTHRELRELPGPAGLPPCDCPGTVEVVGSIPDLADPDHATIDVYRCADCGNTIPVEHFARRVRNDYADPRAWICELIARLADRGRVRS